MSEVEKMYENAGVLKECLSPCYINKTWRKTHDCPNCDNRENYPPFTAEKQIELIKFLAKENFVICKNLGGWHTGIIPTYDEDFGITCKKRVTNFGSFTEALAGLINSLWQDLTEEEKQQVKGVLE